MPTVGSGAFMHIFATLIGLILPLLGIAVLVLMVVTCFKVIKYIDSKKRG